VLDSKYILAGSKRPTARLFSVNKTGVVKMKPFLFLGHRDIVVGVFLGVDKMTNTVCRAYTVTQDCYIFSWELSGGDGKFYEMGGENSGPDLLRTPEREVETESGNGVSVKNKKREGLDGNLENGGKWRLTRKDGFG
jgi:periodic tryptophan protein 2